MTNIKLQEKLEYSLRSTMALLRGIDVERGVMNKEWEPFNGLLSAEETKKCWHYLAKKFLISELKKAVLASSCDSFEDGLYIALFPDSLFKLWLSFLQDVNNVVKCGDRDGTIERVINDSGISEETWVRFLD